MSFAHVTHVEAPHGLAECQFLPHVLLSSRQAVQASDGNVSIVTDAPDLDGSAQAAPNITGIPCQQTGLRVARGVDATQSGLRWCVTAVRMWFKNKSCSPCHIEF